MEKLRGFGLAFFLLEIESGNKNVFDWIFKNIFNKIIFLNESKIKNNKASAYFTFNNWLAI